MSASVRWNGKAVSVISTLIPRFLWQTASIDVFVDGECILRTGGQFRLTGSHASEFTHSGHKHRAFLSWGYASVRSFPITLAIDDKPVLESRVYTSNWLVGLWPWALVVGLALFWASK
jgi:hypothetical protein